MEGSLPILVTTDSKSCGVETAKDPQGSNLARKRASFLVRLAPLAQWQSSGLLTRWFRVRPPGGALLVPTNVAQAQSKWF